MMMFISQVWRSAFNTNYLAIVFGGLISLVFSVNLANAADTPEPKVLVLGDSISAAYGIEQQQGWVYLLQDALRDNGVFINASVSGETTAGGLQRLPALLTEHRPNIVIIELGGNDGLRGYPILSIRKNLQKLITLSIDAGANVLLLGMKIPPNYGKRYTDAFEQNYVQLAKQNSLSFVPFLLASVAGVSTLMQSDGIHPTAAAQPLIVQNVLPVLREMLD